MGFDPQKISFQVWNEHLRNTWPEREGEGDSCVIIKLGLAQAARVSSCIPLGAGLRRQYTETEI